MTRRNPAVTASVVLNWTENPDAEDHYDFHFGKRRALVYLSAKNNKWYLQLPGTTHADELGVSGRGTVRTALVTASQVLLAWCVTKVGAV